MKSTITNPKSEMPIKVLHTEWSEGWGGQEMRILMECLALKERGLRVIIACQPNSCLARKCLENGMDLRFIKIHHNFDPFAVWRLYKLMKEEEIDVVNTHSSRDSWVASIAAKMARVPALIRSRHLSVPVSRSFFNVIYRFPDAIVTSGETVKKMIIDAQRILPEKIYSIPAGVDLGRFRAKGVVAGFKEELGIKDMWPVISKVAVLRSWKGHDFFLKSALKVLREFPKACFLIVGDGPQRTNIERCIEELNLKEHVVMTGFRSDICEILNITDVMVLASKRFEATSQVIPQAMAVGVPVVATDTGGIGELVKNEETGILVRPDPDAIAEGIIKVLKNPGLSKALTRRARVLVESKYNWDKQIESLLGVYYHVLSKKGGCKYAYRQRVA